MSKERSLYEEVLDYVVYAPVGVVLSLVEDLPGLVERGRSKIAGPLATANMVGRFAYRTLERRIGSALVHEVAPDAPAPPVPSPPRSPLTGNVAVRDLPIAGYDSLAASQIVARLEGLSTVELVDVQSYETSHRGRRTILSRVAQLLDEAHDVS